MVAFGSFTNKLGDTRLFYTEGCSDKTRYVKSEFQDARHVLSKDFASVLWQYGADKDVYRLKHVQGWNVHFEAEARIYPYRAAFEVACRDMTDLNKEHFLVSKFIEAIPQNTQYKDTDLKEGAEELERNVDEKFVPSTNPEAKCLSEWMEYSFYTTGKKLCIELDMTGKSAFGKDVFQLPEFRTLLAAIELLPIELARFVSFGFAVDENYNKFAAGNFVNIMVKGSKFASDVETMAWEAVTKTPCGGLTVQREAFKGLKKGVGFPSGTNTLDNLLDRLPKQVLEYKQIIDAKPSTLKGVKWETWLCAHEFKEIKVKDWKEFDDLWKNIPETSRQGLPLRQDFTESQKATLAVLAPNDEMLNKHFAGINFNESELKRLRDNAVSEYLLSKCAKYACLFPEGCNYDFNAILTDGFLKEHLTDNSFDSWWAIFKDKKCLTPKIQNVFKSFMTSKKYADLVEIATAMRKLDSIKIGSQLKEYHYELRIKQLSDLPKPDSYKNFPNGNQDEAKELIQRIYEKYKNDNTNIETFMALIKSCKGDNEKELLSLFNVKDVTAFLATKEDNSFGNLADAMLNRLDDIPLLKDKELRSALFSSIADRCPEVYDLSKWRLLLSRGDSKLIRVLKWMLKWKIEHMDEQELIEFCEKTSSDTPSEKPSERVKDLKKIQEFFSLEPLLTQIQMITRKNANATPVKHPKDETIKKGEKKEDASQGKHPARTSEKK